MSSSKRERLTSSASCEHYSAELIVEPARQRSDIPVRKAHGDASRKSGSNTGNPERARCSMARKSEARQRRCTGAASCSTRRMRR